MTLADQILAELRVPDLPYPVGSPEEGEARNWKGLLAEKWQAQVDETLIDFLKGRSEIWTMRQVNAAYLADRTMDVFLLKSGLHPALAERIARLRFWLAWRLEAVGAEILAEQSAIRRWLDSLGDLRGWSDSGGRADRRVLDRLDDFIWVVAETFERDSLEPLEAFVNDWCGENEAQRSRVARLRQRLLETEQGAARQRAAEQRARAVIGRALAGRRLARAVADFIDQHWHGLMRRTLLERGLDSDAWRHLSRLLEWLVWVADPQLSDPDRDRLYQVGEQLPDKILAVWNEITGGAVPPGATDGIQALLVARLRGEPVPMVDIPARPQDPRWLERAGIDGDEDELVGEWCVEGEGASEQRRFLFAVLPESAEVLWTNGAGVKLGLEPVAQFRAKLETGDIRRLPPLNPFPEVLEGTLAGLSKVVAAQRKQRTQAAEKARAQARAVREARQQARREAEEAQRQKAEALKAAEIAELEREQAAAARELERQEAARLEAIERQVDELRLGGWIELQEGQEKLRLKLAVRINASGKLILVDRLGLNRREMGRQQLIERLLEGQARILSEGAAFDEALSRVVGRIRVGKKS